MNHSPAYAAILDTPDERDFQWQEIGFASVPFDWNTGYDVEIELSRVTNTPNFKLPVKDQDGSGSCGGQAWSAYDSVFEAMATGSFEERSAKYIYAQTFVLPAGSAGRTNSELVKNQGVAREALLTSYDNGNPPSEAFMQRPQDITAAHRADAKQSRAKGYANVSPIIDEVAQAIRENHGVVIGVVGQNNGTWLTPFPTPPTVGGEHWYHWMYAGKAKMINGVKHVGVLNSWGTSCGDKGWQWLSEDYFKLILPGDNYGRAIWSVWTQVFDPASVDDAFHYTFKNQMDFGAIGEDVVALQKALKLQECFPSFVPATGLFGLITKQSVQKFQKKYGLEQVGRVGPKTLAKLNELYAANS